MGWLATISLALGACTRADAPRATASNVEGGSIESFEGGFSEIVASDKMSRTAWLGRKATDSEPSEFVRIGVDDGRILERTPTRPSTERGGHVSPFTMTQKRTPSWELDDTYDVCFFMRTGARPKKVDCMKAVIGATSRCDGGICTLFAHSHPGPVVFTLVEDGTGDVLGSGSLQAASLDDVTTQNGRVAMRFGVSHAVIDLAAKKVYERIPVANDNGEVHDAPLAWFGNDDLLSCEVDPHADRRRPCKRIDILPLADTSKWRVAPEHIRFEFATKRRPG
jgi:hypothetical protein